MALQGVGEMTCTLGEMRNREVFDAYANALKAKANVEVNQANLEKK